MTGNPAAGMYASIVYGIALIYGFTIINIPIGLVGGLLCIGRHAFLPNELKEKNWKLCRASFISMMPICGPILAVNHLTSS